MRNWVWDGMMSLDLLAKILTFEIQVVYVDFPLCCQKGQYSANFDKVHHSNIDALLCSISLVPD